MRPLPDLARRWVMRVPAQPYLRWDTNDHSLEPRLAGRRVEVRVSQAELSAVALGTELHDPDTYLKLADNREQFLAHLAHGLDRLSIE